MQYKAAIFDLDGTLVNSLADIAQAANYVLKYYDLPVIPVDDYKQLVGAGVRPLMESVLGENKQEHLEQALDMWHKYYFDHTSNHTLPYDGIESMLNSLAENNLKLAVLSNKSHELTQKIVSALLHSHKFEIVRGLNKDAPPKPNITSANQLLEKLSLKPKQCLYVGDTKTDMLTGKATGMFTVGVSWGFRDRKELEEHGADAIIDKPEQLLQFV